MTYFTPSNHRPPQGRKTPEHWNALASVIGAIASALTFLLGFIALPAAGVHSPAGTPVTQTVTATVTTTVTTEPQASDGSSSTRASTSPAATEDAYTPILAASKVSIPPQSGVCNGNFMFVDLDEPRVNAESGRIDGGPCIEGTHNAWLSNALDTTTNMESLDAAGCEEGIRSSPANSPFQLRKDLDWCQYTNDNNVAWVHVVDTSDDGSLVMEVTTWSVG
ncbi:hypothetical protein ACIPSE_33980 [Streptomyces sp. NPDC090106]|uniref:hypothetical protein n=1 Tax=Streptomyces sp. NPDC090106 TaxID=3365946 RepID=UPI00381F11E1